jgi:AcrR family transcriptional regulator
MQPDAITEVESYRHGRVPRAVRERQILALAEDLFAEHGYEGASMDELARRAGVSKPVIYDLVESKEALYRLCFERAADELAESVAAAAAEHVGDLAELLRATALAFFRFIDHHRAAWAVLSALDAGGRTAAHVSGIRARQARFAVTMLTERAAKAGVTLDLRRADAAAHALNGAYEALAHWWRENPEVPAETLADWLVELTLPGLQQLTEQ